MTRNGAGGKPHTLAANAAARASCAGEKLPKRSN